MTRIAILKRDEMNAEQRRVFDAAKLRNWPTGGPNYAYVRYPRLMRATGELGAAIRESTLTPRERQIVVLTTIRHWGAHYPWAVQVRASLAAGLDQAAIDAINARRTPTLADPRERLAYRVAHELLNDKRLSDGTYEATAKAFGEEELVALVAAVGNFSMVCCTANAFAITPPEDAPSRLIP